MDALAAVVSFAAIAGPAVLVLRDIVAEDRPAAEKEPEFAEAAPPLVVAPVLGVGRLPAAEPVETAVAVPDLPPLAPPVPVVVPEPVPGVPPVVVPEREPVREQVTEVIRVREPVREPVREQHRESVLASLAHTETDERSALRRIGALLVLLTLTLLTAALVGAGIYRAVSALG